MAYFGLNKTPQNRLIDAIGQVTRNMMEMFERWMRRMMAMFVSIFMHEKHSPEEFVMYRFEEPKAMTPEDQWDNLSRYMENLQKHG